jgi:shikimate kinase
MCLILIGFKNCGKTTLGALVAHELKLPFFDTDRIVQSLYDPFVSCREIVQREGESYFRALEKQAVASLKGCREGVIATGGGTLIDDSNAKQLKELGKMIYLKASFSLLASRFDQMPSFVKEGVSLQEIAESRFSLYERWADEIVEVDDHAFETLCRIASEYAGK